MALEHRDGVSGRWLLYRSQSEHSEDCDRYPYDAIPRRVFLDTNVINLIVNHAGTIFEQHEIDVALDETAKDDVEALLHIFQTGQRMGWPIFASHKSLEELGRTPEEYGRSELVAYGARLVDSLSEDARHAADLGRRLVDAPFTAALPDLAARELIGNAIGLGCDVFCTCDRRTIVRKRDRLNLLPIRVLTPPEWWKHIKPWAGLWL